MASPQSTFSELAVLTLHHRNKELADNISANNALWSYLRKRDRIDETSGGTSILEELDFAENGTYQRYSGWDKLNIQASEVFTTAEFQWMQAAMHVVASGRELNINSGKEQMIPLVKAKTTNAKRTAANNMSVDLYSNGALANQMGGLAHIVQSDGGGTVGGIVSTTWTFWKNQFLEFTGTPSSTTIKSQMDLLWLKLVRGSDKPNLIIMSHDFFSYYWASQQELQRYTSADTADAGFQTLKYAGVDTIFDSNVNYTTTAKRLYMLNTDFLKMRVHPNANWTVKERKESLDQDGVVIPLLWMGNLTCSNRALQGVLVDLS